MVNVHYVVILSVDKQNVTFFIVILSGIMLSASMVCVIMLSVTFLFVILSTIMLNVVVPFIVLGLN